jgi:hypothetical protein
VGRVAESSETIEVIQTIQTMQTASTWKVDRAHSPPAAFLFALVAIGPALVMDVALPNHPLYLKSRVVRHCDNRV